MNIYILLLIAIVALTQVCAVQRKGSDQSHAQCGIILLTSSGRRRFFIADGARFDAQCQSKGQPVGTDKRQWMNLCADSFSSAIQRYPLSKPHQSSTIGQKICDELRPNAAGFKLGYFISLCGGQYEYTGRDGPEKVCCDANKRNYKC